MTPTYTPPPEDFRSLHSYLVQNVPFSHPLPINARKTKLQDSTCCDCLRMSLFACACLLTSTLLLLPYPKSDLTLLLIR